MGAVVRTPMPLSEMSAPTPCDFGAGAVVSFRVRLNPVTSVTVPGGRGRKVVVPEPERTEWATAQLRKAGLDADIALHDSGYAPIKRGAAHVIWSDFEGTATVTDPAALRTAIISGLGRQKAYGCGMLEVQAL